MNDDVDTFEIEEPIGKFVIECGIQGVQTCNGVFYHYSDVCNILKLYKIKLKNEKLQ